MLKRMLKDCVPTIIALTFSGLYSIIDGLFVGNAAGDTGLAAINLAWPIPAFITAVGLGIGTGGSILYSNAKGKGEWAQAEKLLHTTMFLLAAGALLVMAVLWFCHPMLLRLLGARSEVYAQAESYSRIIILGSLFQIGGAGIVPLLRNLSMPVEAMQAMIVGMLTNLGLNYMLIVKAGMGITGAAIGTIIAQCVVCAICLFRMWKSGVRIRSQLKKDGMMQNRMQQKKDSIENKKAQDVAAILKTGFPAFGVSLAPTVVLMFTNLQCLNYGGNEAVAAYAVISYIVFPIQSLLQGVGDGLQPLMSYYIGAGEKEKLQQLKKYAYRIILMLGSMSLVAAIGCQRWIGNWFHLSEEAAVFFAGGFVISALSFLFYGFSKFNVAYMNSNLKVKTANGLIYGECLVISPILIFGLPVLFGMRGIWISLPATSVTMLLIYGIKKPFILKNLKIKDFIRKDKK